MAARDEQGDKRRGELRILHRRREQVPLEVIHADETSAAGVRQRLRVHDAHQQRPDESGSLRDGDGVHRAPRHARFGARALDDRRQGGEVGAAGELGNDAAEHLMDVLRQDDQAGELGRAAPAAPHEDGGRSLVARCLDAEQDLSHGPSSCAGRPSREWPGR